MGYNPELKRRHLGIPLSRDSLKRQNAEARERMTQKPPPLRLQTGTFWWVWGVEDGRRILFGSFSSEGEAYQVGYAKLSGNFEVVPLKTIDVSAASRILRARVLNETEDVTKTFKRFKHKVD